MELLTTKEAAALFRMGRKRFLALPIPYIVLGKRSRRYRREDLDEYVRNHMVGRPAPALPAYDRRRAAPIQPPPRIPTWEEIEALAKQLDLGEKQPQSNKQQPGSSGTKTQR